MIAAVLLAAGNASRFGGTQKLLAPVRRGGTTVPLIRLTAQGLVSPAVAKIIVVVGREGIEVQRALAGLPLRCVPNPHRAAGMSSSLRLGVETALASHEAIEGILVALGDQPLAGTRVVEALAARLCELSPEERLTPWAIVPRYAGQQGNPVLFSRELARELLALTGDRGGRDLLVRHAGMVRYVDLPMPAPPDVDYPRDIALVEERTG